MQRSHVPRGEYMTALLTHYGQWVQPPRRQSTGPMPKSRWMPLPGLLYAQVVKTVRRRRLVRVRHRVVFGALEAVNHVLAPRGWPIQTPPDLVVKSQLVDIADPII
jgi:hypothetical protein